MDWDKIWRRIQTKEDAITSAEDLARAGYTYPLKVEDSANIHSEKGLIEVTHAPTGCMLIKREVLEKIQIDKIKFIGYAFQIEMKFKAWKHGFNVKEVSVIFTDRTLGTSKMSGNIITEALFGVIKMKLKGLPK